MPLKLFSNYLPLTLVRSEVLHMRVADTPIRGKGATLILTYALPIAHVEIICLVVCQIENGVQSMLAYI